MLYRTLEHRGFWIAAWSLLALQLVLIGLATSPWIRGADSFEYLQLANSLATGSFSTPTDIGLEPEALRPPGYPAFLWLVTKWAGLPIGAAIAIQLGIYAACIAVLARWLRPYRFAPQGLMLLALIYVFPAVYVSAIMSEAFATAAVTTVALLAVGPLSKSRLVTIGAVAGLGAMFRPDLVLLPAYVTIVLLVTRKASWRLLLPLAGGAIILAPFTVYNWMTFRTITPMPVASAMGNSLYMSTWQHKLSQDDLNALFWKRATPAVVQSGLAAEITQLNAKIGAPALTAPWHPKEYPTRQQEIASSKIFRAAAVDRISDDPAAYARHVLGNVWKLWNTSVYPPSTPAFAVAGFQLLAGVIAVVGLLGALLTLFQPAGWFLPRSFALVFAYVPGIHVWFHGEARYTTAVRPLLMVFAVAVVLYFAERAALLWQSRNRRSPLVTR